MANFQEVIDILNRKFKIYISSQYLEYASHTAFSKELHLIGDFAYNLENVERISLNCDVMLKGPICLLLSLQVS